MYSSGKRNRYHFHCHLYHLYTCRTEQEQERIANAPSIPFHSFPAVMYWARQQALCCGMGASTTIQFVEQATCLQWAYIVTKVVDGMFCLVRSQLTSGHYKPHWTNFQTQATTGFYRCIEGQTSLYQNRKQM